MSLDDAYNFDPAAFVAAAQALAEKALKPVALPGLPPCFRRHLTAGDVLDAAEVRASLQSDGLEPSRAVDIAIGLAQSLCGPAGQRIFDARNRQHIEILKALPWEAVRDLVTSNEGGDDPNASTDGSST